jgi:pyruvate formate lyase activating enzyme
MRAVVVNIQGYSIHDGPGIRTTVFLKGCNLACRWCSNPECISPYPEIGFIAALCDKCGRCADVCPQKAVVLKADGLPYINRQKCTACGECVPVCNQKALVVYGKEMTVDEVFAEVRRDSMFYDATDGGVTASGGEPLLFPYFVCSLFNQCRKAGIHTCLETAGYAPASALQQVLPSTDYVLYDLKHLDTNAHRRLTGKTNNLVLSNAKLVVESDAEVLFRMPLIPGINDSSQNIKETAAFLKGLGRSTHRIELMPYHRLGESKYEALGRPYPMHGLLPPEETSIESARKAFEECGVQCLVSR